MEPLNCSAFALNSADTSLRRPVFVSDVKPDRAAKVEPVGQQGYATAAQLPEKVFEKRKGWLGAAMSSLSEVVVGNDASRFDAAQSLHTLFVIAETLHTKLSA